MQIASRSSHRVSAILLVLTVVLIAGAFTMGLPLRAADKRIVLIAGRPSHPPGMHEFRAGCLLFQKALTGFPGERRFTAATLRASFTMSPA